MYQKSRWAASHSYSHQGYSVNKPITVWQRYSVLVCLISGFLAGMATWISLMIALGSKENVVYAPFAALPWAVAGTIVGGVSTLVRGFWIPVMAALGTIAGGVYSLGTSPLDGWLAITDASASLSTAESMVVFPRVHGQDSQERQARRPSVLVLDPVAVSPPVFSMTKFKIRPQGPVE
jgi:hypothetical protein